MAVKTGDGRKPAQEEEFEGTHITEQVMSMFDAGEIEEEGSEDEELDELSVEDAPRGGGSRKESAEAPQVEEGEEAAEEEGVADEGAGGEEIEDEEGPEEVSTTEKEELIQLRAEVMAMKNLLENPNADVPLQPEPAEPQVSQAPPAVPASIKPPSEEEFSEILTDPARFAEYIGKSLAVYKQQTLLDVSPMLTNQIMTYETIKDFFGKDENLDVSSGAVRQLVIQTAGNLEAQGQFTGIANTLQRAAEMVRTKLQIAKGKGSVRVGRKNLDAARVGTTKTTARRFASGNQTRKTGKGLEDKPDETMQMIGDMARVGGRI